MLLAFLIELLLLGRFSHTIDLFPQGDDMKFYSDWGRRIAAGQLTDGKAFYGLPGYAYVLGGFYKVLGFNPFSVGAFQALLFALVAGVIYQLSVLSFPRPVDGSGPDPRLIGILAALGWICFLPAQTFSMILMPTIWVVLAYWGCVVWLLKTRDGQPGTVSIWKPWLLMGLAMGVMSMMVATILMLSPLVIFTLCSCVAAGEPLKRRLPRAAAATAVFFAAIFAGSAPAALHNHLIAHEPVMLSAHSGINFWIGNNPTANGYPKMPPGIRASQEGLLKDSITLAERAVGHKMTRAEVSQFWSAQADAYIHNNFRPWLGLMGTKFLNFWNTFQYDDITTIKRLRDQNVTLGGLGFGSVAALGLVGMCFGCLKNVRARWVAAGVVLHMAALMPVFVTERYRLAAVPGLLIFGAWWMATLWQRFALGQWKGALSLGAGAIAAAWLVSMPRADASLWSLDLYNAGIHDLDAFETYKKLPSTKDDPSHAEASALAAGALLRAQTNLLSAERYSPTNADVNFALGNLRLSQGQRDQAKAYYRRALELSPRHERTLNNLGVFAMEEKRYELAERFFSAALEVEPHDAKMLFMLATARKSRGDKAGARSALAQALEQRPTQPEFLTLRAELDAPEKPLPIKE